MLYRIRRAQSAGLLSLCAALTLAPAFARAIDVPDPAWANYGDYYKDDTSTVGSTLLGQLRTTISTGFTAVSYADARVSQAITDRVPGTSGGQMWSVYDRTTLTVSATSTWNREHVFPDSKIESPASNHDLFGLRPALVATNNGRGNNAYGGAYETGVARLLPVNPGASTKQFFAGEIDKGDVARAMLYMATRYSNLRVIASPDGLTNGNDTTTGDLTSLLHWHYQDLPDTFERRRNQLIYINTENSNVDQHNRNPYVDHPEFVWAVWGDGANDSQITVNTGAAGGASSKAVSLGRTIVGGAVPTLSTSVAISKTGVDPTTFSVTTSGAATADGTSSTVRTNIYHGFDYNAGSKSLAVGLTGVSSATAGRTTGTVTIDNTDITTQANVANSGSADGNDTVNLSVDVLDHSNASFAAGTDMNAMTLNFGAVSKNQTATLGFSVYNLLAASGYTAGLDLDGITASGDTAMFGSGLGVFSALAGGSAAGMTASFTPTAQGLFSATYVIAVSDENLSGATTGHSLTLTLTGVSSVVPEPTILALAPMLAMALRRRRAA